MGTDDDGSVPQDLGLIFATNATDIRAGKAFIDRDRERAAFDAAVANHHARVTGPDFDSQDVVGARHNVQVFHGAGGIGKSTLSRALESRLAGSVGSADSTWPPMQRPFVTSVTVRIDLASEAGLSLERALLLIRVAVGRLGSPMHAFDLALSRYWEQVHPDQPLADFIRNDGALSRASEALKLPEQIQEGLKEPAQAVSSSSTAVSVATQLAATVLGALRKKRSTRHAIAECRRLQALLEAESDIESLSYYPHLLAWDLSTLSKRREGRFHVVVFLDTFEDATRGPHRNFEQLLQRLIWLMPDVLFVITGRNRLDWADETSKDQAGWSSTRSWPGLAAGATLEPAQHHVGNLLPPDCLTYLALRLRRDGQAVIPEEARRWMAEESEGYPLHLDMAVSRYVQIVAAGGEPARADFVGGFPGLLARVLRDLGAEERRLVRILSLLDSFDIDLAVRVADLRSQTEAVRLTHRAFVDHDEEAALPYSIHRRIRQEMKHVTDAPDSFTPADWARYAQRAFDTLGERYHQATRSGDRTVANSALNQALRLADEHHLDLGWCVDAAHLLIEDSLWEGSVRPLIGPDVASPAALLAQALLSIGGRNASRSDAGARPAGDALFIDLRETADALSTVLAGDTLQGEARDLATYYAAETLRELGDGAEAERLIRSITGHSAQIDEIAAKGLVHRLRRLGRFRELHQLIDRQPREAVWLQMAGTLSWSQGRLEQAETEYRTSREQFLEAGYLGNADELLGSLTFVRGLGGGRTPKNRARVAEGVAAMADSRNRWATLMAELGQTMLDADGSEALAARNLAISQAGEAAGLTSIQSYAHLSLCLNAALADDPERLARARAALTGHATVEDFHWLLEIVDFWRDEPADESGRPAPADWLDGQAAARERWRRILSSHQDPDPAPTGL